MTPADMLGLVAAITTTVCFLPQVVRVVRYRDTRALSLTMYLLFVVGIVLWLVYGLVLGALPIILANVFTLVQAVIILYFKATEGQRLRDRAIAEAASSDAAPSRT